MLNTVLKLALFLILLTSTAAHANRIYKHVDEHGNVTYSDDPPSQDAEKLKLKPLNTTPPIEIKSTAEKSSAPNEGQDTPDIKPYKLRIASPADEYQVGPAQQVLSVILMTQRPLDDNHYFQLSINGEVYKSATKSNNINIDVHRSLQGRRLLSAAIVDDKGVTIDSTAAITIYVIRPPVNKPKTP